ncbi:hypothetical protein ACJX0J_031966, partial [Zea mays]
CAAPLFSGRQPILIFFFTFFLIKNYFQMKLKSTLYCELLAIYKTCNFMREANCNHLYSFVIRDQFITKILSTGMKMVKMKITVKFVACEVGTLETDVWRLDSMEKRDLVASIRWGACLTRARFICGAS